MNTNQLKKFAQEARRKLIDQVSAKLNYVLTSDSAELREKGAAVQKLKEALKETSKEQLVDKVAYTWFNRFVALRFMDLNDYQPIGVQVLSTLDGFTTYIRSGFLFPKKRRNFVVASLCESSCVGADTGG